MDTGAAKDLFNRYSAAVAYVEVESPTQDVSIGSAFHIGNSVFVTARHVVHERRILSIGFTETQTIPLPRERSQPQPEVGRYTNWTVIDDEVVNYTRLRHNSPSIEAGPFVFGRADVDVAVFSVRGIDLSTPYVHLGTHLDMELGESDFVLDDCIAMGYPPIPYTSRPHLVAVQAHVTAQVSRRDVPHPHFVISATPRGGFSGGVVIHEKGMVLGVVTTSLLAGAGSPETGLMAVVSVEPVYQCLIEHDLLPDEQNVPSHVTELLKRVSAAGESTARYRNRD